MKSYEQMAKDVLKRRDEHLLRKQQRRTTFRYYMPMMASFGFAVLIGLGIWQDLQKLPEISTVPVETKSDTIDSEIVASEQESSITEQAIIMTEPTETQSEQIVVHTTTELTESVKSTQESVSTDMTSTESALISVIATEIEATSETEEVVTSSEGVTNTSSTQNSIVSDTTVIDSSTENSIVVPMTTNTSMTDMTEPPVPATTSRITEIIITTTTTDTTTQVPYHPISTEPTDPTEPSMEPTEPIAPTESTESFEPSKPTMSATEIDLPSPELYKICVLSGYGNSFEYQTAGLEVSADKIETYLEQVEPFGYDKNGNYQRCQANAYAIANISVQDAIAVQFADRLEYFVYLNINLTSEQQELLLAGL